MNNRLTSIMLEQQEQLRQMSKNIVANFLEQYDKTILKQLEFAIYLSESNDTQYQELYQHIVEEYLYADHVDFNSYIKDLDDITCATKDDIFENVSHKWLAQETLGKVWVGYRTALGMLLNLNLHYGILSFENIKWILLECIIDRTNFYLSKTTLIHEGMYWAYNQIRVEQNIENDIKQLIKTYGEFNNHEVAEEIIDHKYFETIRKSIK